MQEIKQHSALKSILLHLFPGIFILALIFLFSNPFFTNLFGFDSNLSPILGYLMAILFGVIPILLVILFFASKYETGKFNIKEIINYTEKGKLKEYLLYVPLLIVYFVILFVVIAPIIQPFIVKTFFSWWPEQYNFQLILQDPSKITGYGGVKILIIFYILLSCILGPIVEELYFRGYLLPRMEKYSGKWAPFLNTVLFSVYHFFSPWENLIRIVAGYPLIYLVWKKKNIRYGMLVHILVNMIGGIVMLVAIYK